jgi:hypothetical protein
MKTKIMIISVLTAACIFVFSGATWAESKKERRNKNTKQKHYTVSKHSKPVHQQNQWKQASRYQDKKHRYHKRFHQQGKYRHPGSHNRDYRYKPYYRHLDKHGRYYKPRHYIHRPVKKYQRNRYHRPIYSKTNGNVSIRTSTSRRGWSIKISSKD